MVLLYLVVFVIEVIMREREIERASFCRIDNHQRSFEVVLSTNQYCQELVEWSRRSILGEGRSASRRPTLVQAQKKIKMIFIAFVPYEH